MTPPPPAPLPAPTATRGWHDDPQGQHYLRFHDGQTWTDSVTHFGPVPCTGCESEHGH